MSGVVHIVLFRFRADAGASVREDVQRRFLALADGERDGRRFIRSIRSGPNTSPEGLGHGYDVGFVVEFDTADDRDWYLESDPAHVEFSESVGAVLDTALVFDIAGQRAGGRPVGDRPGGHS